MIDCDLSVLAQQDSLIKTAIFFVLVIHKINQVARNRKIMHKSHSEGFFFDVVCVLLNIYVFFILDDYGFIIYILCVCLHVCNL